jgi:hypothetical protein
MRYTRPVERALAHSLGIVLSTLMLLPGAAHAQETPSEPAADAPSEPAAGAPAEPTVSSPSEVDAQAPKLAVVVVGDPDPPLRAAALRVERAVVGRLRAPFDPGLRAALRGEPGEADDGLGEVRRERRRLGLDEARDAPVLAALGRRAGARVVAAVRSGNDGPVLMVLDVEASAFYEGSIPLGASTPDARIARFLMRRARASQRGPRVPAPAEPSASAEELPAPTLPPAAAEPLPEPEAPPARQPDFFEQFWPYLVAGALLAGMITAIALTSSGPNAIEQPALRFVPP